LAPQLQVEVRNLRDQMGILSEFCLCGAAPSVQGNDNPNIDPQDVQDNIKHNAQGSNDVRLAHALLEQQPQANETYAQAEAQAKAQAAARVIPPPTPLIAHRFINAVRNKAGKKN
jgi:hypothetical protein